MESTLRALSTAIEHGDRRRDVMFGQPDLPNRQLLTRTAGSVAGPAIRRDARRRARQRAASKRVWLLLSSCRRLQVVSQACEHARGPPQWRIHRAVVHLVRMLAPSRPGEPRHADDREGYRRVPPLLSHQPPHNTGQCTRVYVPRGLSTLISRVPCGSRRAIIGVWARSVPRNGRCRGARVAKPNRTHH
jgi:hypothetical protein